MCVAVVQWGCFYVHLAKSRSVCETCLLFGLCLCLWAATCGMVPFVRKFYSCPRCSLSVSSIHALLAMQNAYGLTWSNQYRNGAGQQVAPTLRAMQLRADGTGPHMLLAAGSHTALILSPQGHQLDLLSLPVSTYKVLAVVTVWSVFQFLLGRPLLHCLICLRILIVLPSTTSLATPSAVYLCAMAWSCTPLDMVCF